MEVGIEESLSTYIMMRFIRAKTTGLFFLLLSSVSKLQAANTPLQSLTEPFTSKTYLPLCFQADGKQHVVFWEKDRLLDRMKQVDEKYKNQSLSDQAPGGPLAAVMAEDLQIADAKHFCPVSYTHLTLPTNREV